MMNHQSMDPANDDIFELVDVNPSEIMELFHQEVVPDDKPDDITNLFDGNNDTHHFDGNFPTVGNIPTTEEYCGPYNFSVSMDTNGQKWVYSQPLELVFIEMNKVIVLKFQTGCELPPNETFYIRALPVYSNNEHITIPVSRCTFHACEDDPQSQAHIFHDCRCSDFNNVGHVVRAQCNSAIYCYDKHSGRHSVKIPVNRPQPGSDNISIPYSFACKTSCPKGMQRRSINLIFTLETSSGMVWGRRLLGVKICSCPKRDKDRQEKDYWALKVGETKKRTLQHNEQPSKKIKQERLEQVQLSQVVGTDEDLRREVKELKSMMANLQNVVTNILNDGIMKLNQKLEHIIELHNNRLFIN